MKITFAVTIEVDQAAWIAREGLDDGAAQAAVRADVREYLYHMLTDLRAVEGTGMIIWRGWKR